MVSMLSKALYNEFQKASEQWSALQLVVFQKKERGQSEELERRILDVCRLKAPPPSWLRVESPIFLPDGTKPDKLVKINHSVPVRYHAIASVIDNEEKPDWFIGAAIVGGPQEGVDAFLRLAKKAGRYLPRKGWKKLFNVFCAIVGQSEKKVCFSESNFGGWWILQVLENQLRRGLLQTHESIFHESFFITISSEPFEASALAIEILSEESSEDKRLRPQRRRSKSRKSSKAKNQADAEHSPDFRSVNWFGTQFSFTPTQAACIKVLWEAWEKGTPEIGQDRVILEADSHNKRLAQVFRQSEAWGKMIVRGKSKGSFKLNSLDARKTSRKSH